MSGAELSEPAFSRYAISVMGGDAVFLEDRRRGHRLYIGSARPLSRPELRRHVSSLNDDLKALSVGDFLTKYDLNG
ncbi:MAG TPA: hypothetical protein VMX94_10105 [Armatimonadota bacterium]|nr:hypothetical protein [Armatimonadota bacterium]